MRLPRYASLPALAAVLAALVYAGIGPGNGLLSRAAALVAPRRPAMTGASGYEAAVRRRLAALPAVGEARDRATPRRAIEAIEAPRAVRAVPREGQRGERRRGPGPSGAALVHRAAVMVGTSVVIPRLGVHAPVYDRGDDGHGHLPIATGYAVTHYTFSGALGQPGNYVIYGHDDIQGSIFQNLPSMQPGDKVYLHHGTRTYTYEVTGSMIVLPRQVSVMDPTAAPTLTMISCTPLWVDSHRIVVKARLIGAAG